MKKKLLFLTLSLALLLCVFSLGIFAENTEESGVSLSIEAANLSFEDSVYVLYAVSHEGIDAADIKMLFWSEPQGSLDNYTYGTQSYTRSYTDDGVSVNGKSCAVFKNDTLRAKNMADYVYARAYAVVDGIEYYSDISKYSILQYAYNKLGKTGTASDNEALKNMLESMLEYGADAQVYANHNTDRLANGEFYQVIVEGGVILEDGFTKGLYLATETATLVAPVTSGGIPFGGWQNSTGDIISTEDPFILTGISANETYTAIYEEEYSKGLDFALSDDGTYYSVTGLGSCGDIEITIPQKYKGLPVAEIADYAFAQCDLAYVKMPESIVRIGNYAFCHNMHLPSVKIPSNVKIIGDSAFEYCTYLESVTIGDSVTSIGARAFSGCSSLKSVTIGNGVTSIENATFSNCSSLTSVIFENPNGWWYSGDSTATSGTSISATDLSDSSTAARYLKSNYSYYYWHRD